MTKTSLRRVFILLLPVLTLALTAGLAAADLQAIQSTGSLNNLRYGAASLTGTPEYDWWYGCSPTSGGMLMGYWYGKGYTSLLPGVTNYLTQTAAVNQAIASSAHIAAGAALGYTYGSYQNHAANSIADFMKTENAGTYAADMPTGLKDWAAYTGVATKTAYNADVSLFGGTFDYTGFKAEIDAGRPMLLNLATFVTGQGSVGHTILGYGYQENMFNLKIYNGYGYQNITVPGFAVMDTWLNGVGPGKQSDWLGWDENPVYAQLDGQGREWWPFLDMTQTGGWVFNELWDWQIDDGVFYEPAPVPAALLLFGSGLLALLWRRRPAQT